MEIISSRKNAYVQRIKLLSSDKSFREEQGEYVCDGMKFLKEALSFGAEVTGVLWKDTSADIELPPAVRQYVVPSDLFDYASSLKNSPGPVFTVRIPQEQPLDSEHAVIVLENVQDPGNVGTVIRSANAFKVGTVILVGDCADLYHPKTVRATMGAVFRQRVIRADHAGLKELLLAASLPLYGAELSDRAVDIRTVSENRAAYAIGSEGRGLSQELLSMCEKSVIIPMNPESESLNAAVAAAVIMWETCGRRL